MASYKQLLLMWSVFAQPSPKTPLSDPPRSSREAIGHRQGCSIILIAYRIFPYVRNGQRLYGTSMGFSVLAAFTCTALQCEMTGLPQRRVCDSGVHTPSFMVTNNHLNANRQMHSKSTPLSPPDVAPRTPPPDASPPVPIPLRHQPPKLDEFALPQQFL